MYTPISGFLNTQFMHCTSGGANVLYSLIFRILRYKSRVYRTVGEREGVETCIFVEQRKKGNMGTGG